MGLTGRVGRGSTAALCCLAVIVAATAAAWACSTPVFRYAMYNWPSAPFHVV